MSYEVVIIGGSYAGLSAALPLARARRKVLIIDAGQRRNRFAKYSHNFLTQDGREPSAIVNDAKAQIEKYPTVSWLVANVTNVYPINDDYVVVADGQLIQTQKIIIATGVKDEIPNIEGLVERWGTSVHHCPYCDGYELNLGKIGVIASNIHALHLAMMLPDWGDTTLFLNNAITIDLIEDKLLAKLAKRNIQIETRKIVKIDGYCDVLFENGELTTLNGLFISTVTRLQSDWIHTLGLEIETNDHGERLKTSATKETNLSGIYACGDITALGGSVALSVGDGAMAGVMVHKSLIF